MHTLRITFVLIIISLLTLFTYDWFDNGNILARESARMPVSALPIPTTEPALQRTLDRFLADLRQQMAIESIPGLSLAVVKDGQVVLSTGYGITDVDTPYLVNERTVFRIASLSKGFAPVLVGMLVDEGVLRWDDPVIQYLPDFKLSRPEATRDLTLRHLLNHTTGLPRHAYSNLLNQAVPYPEIVPRLAGVRLAHAPGASYNYQNVAYSLIGDVVKAATGISYDSLLVRRIFEPLGMETASVGYRGMMKTSRAAQPHGRGHDGYYRIELHDKWYDVSPAAGVNASAHDLAQWLLLMTGYRPDLLSAESLAEITRKQIDVSPREGVMRPWRPLEESGYGLGWRTLKKDGREIIFHGGFVNGYRAEIGFCPATGLGIAILTNGANHFIGEALPRFFDGYFNPVLQ